MNSMRYKSFTWRNNPSRCAYDCERVIAKHKYPQLKAVELEDLDLDAAVISGSGEFFGPTAYQDWNKLVAVFKEGGIGQFYHPVFTDVVLADFKKLNASLEPRENYVAYTFEFWQHMPPVIKTQDKASTSIINPNKLGTIRMGNSGKWVIQLQNKLISDDRGCLPKHGVDGKFWTETESAVRKYQARHKLRIDGIAGPETLGHMGIQFYEGTPIDKFVKDTTSKVHVVKSGDTLSRIGKKYNVDWKDIAKKNKLKDPSVLKVGQKLIIP